ncbi:MAG: YncE family protein [Thermoplasmata archaeon]
MSDRTAGVLVVLALLVVSTSLAAFATPTGVDHSAPKAPVGPIASGSPSISLQPALAPVHPASSPGAIPVGGSPDSILVDPTNNTAFVASEFGDNVSVIDLTTNHVVATIPVGSEPYPQAIALDTTNWTVYVVNSGSQNVSVISIGEESVIASIPVGAAPDAVAVNSFNHDVYVANGGDGTVSIISPATTIPHVIATVPVEADPDALAVNSANHDVFVADAGTGNLSVISSATNTVVKTLGAGTAPGPYGAMLYDPTNNNVYVANVGSDNVSVVGGSNFTDFASIPTGSGPSALALDGATKELYVANRFSDNVSILSTATNTPNATANVGSQPGTNGAIAFNPTLGDIYVPNSGSNSVSVLSGATKSVTATVPVGGLPDAIGTDPLTGEVYVANQGTANVSAFLLSEVTFQSAGLPAGSTWSLVTGTPPVTHSNTTVHGRGIIHLAATTLLLDYSVIPPSGYGVSKVTGPRTPSQEAVTLSGAPSKFVIAFGPIETLTFEEVGLPPSTSWGVSIDSPLHFGGPMGQTATTTGSSIEFTVVKDAWKFQVTTPEKTFRSTPGKGTATVGKVAVVKHLTFRPVTAVVYFEESGLALGTHWGVNVSGPMNVSLSSSGGKIKFVLVNGTYHFTLWNFSTLHPHPATGLFVVIAPHSPAYVEVIDYTSTPTHALRGLGGASPTSARTTLPGAVLSRYASSRELA